MEPPGPLARAVYRLRHLAARSAAERRAHAEGAIDRYLAWCDEYVESLTRKSAHEALLFGVAGEPVAPPRTPVAQVKGDHTHQVLRRYQGWLHQLRGQGLYDGPLTLTRLRSDGAWQPLDLDDEP